jgi:hypothetical protein
LAEEITSLPDLTKLALGLSRWPWDYPWMRASAQRL